MISQASSFVGGGINDPRFNTSYIVKESVNIGKPIMVVAMAYRVSAWGFLASQEVLDSGNANVGLKDQRLALHW